VTVRFCSSCGVVVNESIRTALCPEANHASMRRTQSAYCIDCGKGLTLARSGR
jgi:predicted RNA-binding Zn-ribbon protein involved in translation (DUF1610 family)